MLWLVVAGGAFTSCSKDGIMLGAVKVKVDLNSAAISTRSCERQYHLNTDNDVLVAPARFLYVNLIPCRMGPCR